MEQTTYKLTAEQIRAIESVLRHGDRVEITPVKDGVKLLQVSRKPLTAGKD